PWWRWPGGSPTGGTAGGSTPPRSAGRRACSPRRPAPPAGRRRRRGRGSFWWGRTNARPRGCWPGGGPGGCRTTACGRGRPNGWTVLRAVKWTVLHAVRWTRVIGTGVVLLVAALFIQPPAQGAPAAPAKADPSLYAQSVAHPSETFPVIVREAAPNTDSAESLVKSLGGRVTHELGIVGGFSALVPGSAVPELSASPLVWRVWGDAPVHMQGVSMGQYDYAAANTVWKQVINLPKTN